MVNNAENRIELALDCIKLWGKLEQYKDYKSKELLDKIKAEYYEKIQKLIRYEYEIERGDQNCLTNVKAKV